MVLIKVLKLKENAIIPCYAHPGDAGMDLFSCENYSLAPGEKVTVSTGISMEVPEGYVSLVWGKSGLARKKGIAILGGVIDAHYRGEYMIMVLNTSKEEFEIKQGDKIAQLLIQPVISATLEVVEELSNTSRGDGGFGSTGSRASNCD